MTNDQSLTGVPELMPARMISEYAYCPRLTYLEWVQGEFEDSEDTVEGRFQHRRVDVPGGDLAMPDSDTGREAEDTIIHARSVLLSDAEMGVIARIDLVESDGPNATPVDYKKGTMPNVPGNAYEPERVQLALHGMLLRAHGFQCTEGVVYYVGSKRRVTVPFDETLSARTRQIVDYTRQMSGKGVMPPPLVDSPKCPRCSLVGICLPDEVTFLKDGKQSIKPDDVRRMVVARDDALPVYVTRQGATVGKTGDNLRIYTRDETLSEPRLLDVSSVSVFGNVQVTAQAVRELMDRGIPVCYFNYGGWFKGVTTGMTHKNVELRVAQYRVAGNPELALPVARDVVVAKIRNSRVMLRRNLDQPPPTALAELSRLATAVRSAGSFETLLGIEGAAARVYFANFGALLNTGVPAFDFQVRNRRPPKDPVNSVLSFLYSMLMRQTTVTALSVGFDPFLGFYHQPKYGRPALALDMAEEFRPIIADSVTLTLFNNGELKENDFTVRSGGVSLTPDGRRTVIRAFERRMDALFRHPMFGYSISYRRALEIQLRLLGRHILGELPKYPAFTTR